MQLQVRICGWLTNSFVIISHFWNLISLLNGWLNWRYEIIITIELKREINPPYSWSKRDYKTNKKQRRFGCFDQNESNRWNIIERQAMPSLMCQLSLIQTFRHPDIVNWFISLNIIYGLLKVTKYFKGVEILSLTKYLEIEHSAIYDKLLNYI